MNQNLVILGIVVLIVIGAAFLFTRNQNPKNSQPTTTQETTIVQPQNTTDSGQVATQSATVNIQNFAFLPNVLTVKTGTAVTWMNNDTVMHRIKSQTFNSSDLNQGDTFVFTFNNKGTFNYTCGVHPSMMGQIIVE
ncbi:MAG: cupredoxin domain-containing protein [Candidatus Daviesbacteria bacterium]|nr:cupredoxin domain-containing protein [Candidatus Daviesbacteria bacterium]